MILVAGATGVLGSEIVRRLIARGEQVRAIVRETSAPEKVERLRNAGAEIVTADLKDPASLDRACAGVDSVISTVSMILTGQPGDSFDSTDSAGNRSLVDAAKRAGAKKFVFVSFDTQCVPDSPLTEAKREAEEHLIKSRLDYTILHPSLFFESWLGPMLFADPEAGTAKIYGRGVEKIRYVAVADVAELAVQSLSSPAARNAIIPFGGREAISQRDAVKIFEDTFGKKFSVTEVPQDALERQFNSAQSDLDKAFAALMLGVARGLDSGINPPFDEFPMQMTSPVDYVRQLAKSSPQTSPAASRQAEQGGEAEARA